MATSSGGTSSDPDRGVSEEVSRIDEQLRRNAELSGMQLTLGIAKKKTLNELTKAEEKARAEEKATILRVLQLQRENGSLKEEGSAKKEQFQKLLTSNALKEAEVRKTNEILTVGMKLFATTSAERRNKLETARKELEKMQKKLEEEKEKEGNLESELKDIRAVNRKKFKFISETEKSEYLLEDAKKAVSGSEVRFNNDHNLMVAAKINQSRPIYCWVSSYDVEVARANLISKMRKTQGKAAQLQKK